MKYLIVLIFFSHFAVAASETKNPEKIRLALNWKPEPQFGGFYEALEKRNFLQQGFSVDVLPGGSGTPTIQMLGNQKVEFAVVSAEEILLWNEKNPDKKIVALFAAFQKNPQVIICRKERGFQSMADVFSHEGTLAMQSGLSYAQFLFQKFPQKKVKVVPYPGGISSLLNQKDHCQQGFATSEPLLAEKNGLKVSVFFVADEGFNPYTTVLAALERDLLQHPGRAEKMTSAVRAGWQSYLENPTATNKAMAKLNPAMDAETFLLSAKAQAPLIQKGDEIGSMTPDRWRDLGDVLLRLKVIKKFQAEQTPLFKKP